MVAVARKDIEETVILLRLIVSHSVDVPTCELAQRLADMWEGQLDPGKILVP